MIFMKNIICKKFPIFTITLFVSGLIFLFPQHAHAAIAFDYATTSTVKTASPITWNHTVGSGANTLLIVGCNLYSATQPTATAVTFNGVSMTKIRADQKSSIVGDFETSVWFIHAPASGTYQVSVAATLGTSPSAGCISVSYTGAQQIDTADASNGSTGNGSGDKTFIVTTVADNAWVFAVGANKAGGPTPSITADQTSRGSILTTARTSAEDTNSVVTPAGNTTMGFTIAGASPYWAMTGASFAPAASAVSSGVMSSSHYTILSDSLNFGGGYSTSTNYIQESTGGEVATGISSSTNYIMSAGYQQMNTVALSLVPPSSVVMSPNIGGVTGGTSNGSTTFTVTTDDPAGYTATLQASSSPALVNTSSTTNAFADYSPAGSAPDFTFGIAATASAFAFSPQGTDADQRFLNNTSICNTGTNSTAQTCWDGLSTSPKNVADRTSNNTPAGTQTTLYFRAASGANHIQVNGTYVATTTLTILPL
jgi:hypothetical protein